MKEKLRLLIIIAIVLGLLVLVCYLLGQTQHEHAPGDGRQGGRGNGGWENV